MLYAVTGGTGFLGAHLVSQLLGEGHKVRMLVRKGNTDQRNNVEFIIGSVNEELALRKTFDGVDGIFHLAGIVEASRRRKDYVYEVNVEGTLKVLEIARDLKIRRIVYASTSGTVAVSTTPSQVATDSSPYAKEIAENWPYYDSKIIAEEKAIAFAKENDLDLICMRPTLLLGPGDYRLSSCRSVLDFLEKKIPFVPGGGMSFVDVRDTATSFIAAMEKGKQGSTYLLGHENMSLEVYFKKLEKLSGVKSPFLKVPSTAAWAMASSVYGILGLFGRWDPSLDPVLVEMSQHFWYLDAKKAREELGFCPRPGDETLMDTITWLQQHRQDII